MEWSTTNNLENMRVAFMLPTWPESSSFNSLHSFNYDPYAGIYTDVQIYIHFKLYIYMLSILYSFNLIIFMVLSLCGVVLSG